MILTEKEREKDPPEVTTVRITGEVERPRSTYTERNRHFYSVILEHYYINMCAIKGFQTTILFFNKTNIVEYFACYSSFHVISFNIKDTTSEMFPLVTIMT